MQKIKIICATLALLLFSAICTGCQSTKTVADESILDYQRRIDELEGTIESLSKRCNTTADRLGYLHSEVTDFIESSDRRLEDIRRRSELMEDTIQRIMFLFGEYEREVSELLDFIEYLQGQIDSTT